MADIRPRWHRTAWSEQAIARLCWHTPLDPMSSIYTPFRLADLFSYSSTALLSRTGAARSHSLVVELGGVIWPSCAPSLAVVIASRLESFTSGHSSTPILLNASHDALTVPRQVCTVWITVRCYRPSRKARVMRLSSIPFPSPHQKKPDSQEVDRTVTHLDTT